MESIQYEPGRLPVYTCRECLHTHQVHSEIAHVHKDIELISVLKGSVQCQTGGSVFELHTGDVCFINRGQLHALYEKPSQVDSHRVLVIGTALLTQIPGIYEKYIQGFLEDIRFSHVRFEGKDSPAAQISAAMDRIDALQEEKSDGYELEILSQLYGIISYLYQAYTQGPSLPVPDGNALIQQKMTEYIYGHYNEVLSLDDIAAAGHVSRSQCSRLFKQYTRLTPIQFLNKHRLEMSCEKLRRTSASVAEIAMACGIGDQSYFNRLFHRAYGVTPLEYRKTDRALKAEA